MVETHAEYSACSGHNMTDRRKQVRSLPQWVLLSPAAAQGAVELHDGYGFALLGVHQIEFRGIKTGVRGEHLEVSGGAALISKTREPGGVLCSCDELFLFFAVHALFVMRDQGVGNVAESGSDGLLVVENHLFLGFTRKLELAAKLAAFKVRLRERADAVNGFSGHIEKIRELITADARGGRYGELREKLRARVSALSVGCN